MRILPENLQQIQTNQLEELEGWFSERLYEQMLKRNRGHVLVQLQQLLGWEAIEQACRGFYHQTGPGAKPRHQVGQLVRAILVKALYNWSLRETQERVSNDLVVKWFVGYGVMESVMDYSLLCRFEQWLQKHQPRLLFDTVLNEIERSFPEEQRAVQIGDTFAMEANAAGESWVELLRHLCRKFLRELVQLSPELHQQIQQQIPVEELFGVQPEKAPYFLTDDEIQSRLTHCVRGALQLEKTVQVHIAPQQLETQPGMTTLLADVRQVIGNNLVVARDEHGQVHQVSVLPEKERGHFQMTTATDREATVRHHGRKLTLGFNIHLASTPAGFIREIFSATGAQPDSVGIPHLIANQIRQRQHCPPKLIYDRAASAGHTRAQVERVSQGRTQLVAHLTPTTTGERFGPEQFTLSDDQRALTCPAQQTSTTHYEAADRYGRVFVFKANQHCLNCPCWNQCRAPNAKPTGQRMVFISDYRAQICQAQHYNQSDTFAQEMKLRPLVERVIFMLTHFDGARRAKGYGIPRADFQVKLAATARNIRTWLKRRAVLPIAPLA